CLEPCNGAYFLGYSALPVSVYDARAHLKGSQVHTMLKPIRAVVAAALLTIATYAVAAELRGDHPDTYVVQKGDTLRSEEHTSELQSRENIVCRLLLEKKKK